MKEIGKADGDYLKKLYNNINFIYISVQKIAKIMENFIIHKLYLNLKMIKLEIHKLHAIYYQNQDIYFLRLIKIENNYMVYYNINMK